VIYPITPIGKPRMTGRPGSAHTPAAKRYWAYKDEVRYRRVQIPESGYHITFHIPMAKSWSKKKKLAMDGQPHQQTPDKDNLEKALLDAIFDDDSNIWDGRVTKLWAREGAIQVELIK